MPMNARFALLWYHARLGLSWAGLVPPLFLAGALAFLAQVQPVSERFLNLATVLEVGLPLLAALLAAPLLLAERDGDTLCWLAVRRPLQAVVALRLAVLALYLSACAVLTLLAAHLLWHGLWLWEALPHAAGPALGFATLALLAAHGGRSIAHGYVLAVALWIGTLTVAPFLPHHEPWLTLNPFAQTFSLSPGVVVRSKLFYAAAGLALLPPQWRLLRPERLLRRV
jgi:hypothetical protein